MNGNRMLGQELLTANIHSQFYLDFSSEELEQAWPLEETYSNRAARWNAYINHLCLHRFLAWVQELLQGTRQTFLSVYPQENRQQSLWDVVNGSAITLGDSRLILIPTEMTESDEFSVPREWVDNPDWAGDYYVAFEVNLDEEGEEGGMRFLGYTTHSQIKRENQYNPVDCSYSVNCEDAITDFATLWLTLQVRPCRKANLEPLPPLSLERVRELLEELSQPSAYSPRLRVGLDISFEQWAALLTNQEWRQELYQRRLPQLVPTLTQWLQVKTNEIVEGIKGAGWQLYQDFFGTISQVDYAFNFRRGTDEGGTRFVKQIDWETEAGNCAIALAINLVHNSEEEILIHPQVESLDRQQYLPENLELLVLDEWGEVFDSAEAGVDSKKIQLETPFSGEPGLKFSIQIICGEIGVFEEHFVI
ncbi:MAG: DUF1822 family protein [Actinomycetota bacterium]